MSDLRKFLCKFNEKGERIESHSEVGMSIDEIAAKIEEGFEEVTFSDFMNLLGNNDDSQEYVKDLENGGFKPKPPYEPSLDELKTRALNYQGEIYTKEKYGIAWVTREDGTKIGFDTDIDEGSQVDWNSVRRVLDDLVEAGTFSDGTTPTIPYRYWKEDGTKEYANVTLAELKQAGIVSSQQQNAAYTKFEPILNTIRNATSKAEVEPYLPPEEETETEEVQ